MLAFIPTRDRKDIENYLALSERNDICGILRVLHWNDVVCEEFPIVSDGFTLIVRKLSLSPDPPCDRLLFSCEPRKSALLVHGIADTSFTFLNSGRNESLAGRLLNSNFDVFLFDARGRHPFISNRSLNELDAEFWNFTVQHEIDVDFPNVCDKILHLLGGGRAIDLAVGHSQGAFVTIMSTHEFALNIKKVVAFCPPVFGFGVFSEYPNLFPRNFFSMLGDAFIRLFHLPPSQLMNKFRGITSRLCYNTPTLCIHVICFISGCSVSESKSFVFNNAEKTNRLPLIMSFYPVSSAMVNCTIRN